MLSYSQFAFVAALITTVLACIAYVWAMSAGHRSTSRAPQKKVLVARCRRRPWPGTAPA